MQVTVEAVKDLKRKMSVAIPTALIDEKVLERLKSLSHRVKVAGFRPGKAPFSIIQHNYESSIRSEVIRETINSTFEQALIDQNLQIVGIPEIKVDEQQHTQEMFAFSAIFEVYPKIIIGDLSTQTVVRPVVEIVNEDINHVLSMLRQQHTRFDEVERAAQEKDKITMDFEGTIAQKPFQGGSATDFSLVLGHGYLLPALEKAILGMKKNDKKTVPVVFPKDYQVKSLMGKTAEFALHVKKIEKPELPDLDEDFAKKLGVKTGGMEKLKEVLRTNLEKEVTRRVFFKIRENVMKMLLEAIPVIPPVYLVDKEIHQLVVQAEKELSARSKEVVKLPQKIFHKKAEQNVALNMICGEIIRNNKLTAKPEKIQAVVTRIAESHENPEEIAKSYYADKNRLASVTNIALEEQVVEWVLKKVQIKEEKISFRDMMGMTKPASKSITAAEKETLAPPQKNQPKNIAQSPIKK